MNLNYAGAYTDKLDMNSLYTHLARSVFTTHKKFKKRLPEIKIISLRCELILNLKIF